MNVNLLTYSLPQLSSSKNIYSLLQKRAYYLTNVINIQYMAALLSLWMPYSIRDCFFGLQLSKHIMVPLSSPTCFRSCFNLAKVFFKFNFIIIIIFNSVPDCCCLYFTQEETEALRGKAVWFRWLIRMVTQQHENHLVVGSYRFVAYVVFFLFCFIFNFMLFYININRL